jgi:hypothetical protein
MGACEVTGLEVGTNETSILEVSILEVGVPEVSIMEVGDPKVSAMEIDVPAPRRRAEEKANPNSPVARPPSTPLPVLSQW